MGSPYISVDETYMVRRKRKVGEFGAEESWLSLSKFFCSSDAVHTPWVARVPFSLPQLHLQPRRGCLLPMFEWWRSCRCLACPTATQECVALCETALYSTAAAALFRPATSFGTIRVRRAMSCTRHARQNARASKKAEVNIVPASAMSLLPSFAPSIPLPLCLSIELPTYFKSCLDLIKPCSRCSCCRTRIRPYGCCTPSEKPGRSRSSRGQNRLQGQMLFASRSIRQSRALPSKFSPTGST